MWINGGGSLNPRSRHGPGERQVQCFTPARAVFGQGHQPIGHEISTLFSPAICYDAQHPRYEVINKIKFNEVLEVHGNLNVEVFIISTTF
jgi:hypothetical protein